MRVEEIVDALKLLAPELAMIKSDIQRGGMTGSELRQARKLEKEVEKKIKQGQGEIQRRKKVEEEATTLASGMIDKIIKIREKGWFRHLIDAIQLGFKFFRIIRNYNAMSNANTPGYARKFGKDVGETVSTVIHIDSNGDKKIQPEEIMKVVGKVVEESLENASSVKDFWVMVKTSPAARADFLEGFGEGFVLDRNPDFEILLEKTMLLALEWYEYATNDEGAIVAPAE